MNISDLPNLRLVTCDASRREPGMMVFNVRPGGTDGGTAAGWIIGIDQQGEVALDLKFEAPTQDVRLHPNGNILFSQTGLGLITEIDRIGKRLRQWHMAGKWRGKTPPEDSIEIDLIRNSHTVGVLPGGNLLLLSTETREYPDWPGSDTDPTAATETATLVGDVVAEVAPDGRIEQSWRMLDLIDPYRISYGSRRDHWADRGIPDSFDWAHANCAGYDAADDSILVSLRTQDCIVKFSRATGELKWILGSPNNWRAPWAEKLLTPAGPLDWQYHQHDCSVTPAGTVLCFDNGNHRATPFDPKMPEADCYSRAVEFAVDQAAGTVRQVWSYGETPGQRLFGCFQGGAYRLPQTGNTFITYGGIATLDGVPSGDNAHGLNRARLIEVSPGGEVVFDLWVDSGDRDPPFSLSVFRAEHIPEA
ncbi:MAG: aryl-sulfate sulfotransferase [Proteobacteria bacterium]|nr:aryl-sulfate sulfotransferase [Pseudomonadota bacterium]